MQVKCCDAMQGPPNSRTCVVKHFITITTARTLVRTRATERKAWLSDRPQSPRFRLTLRAWADRFAGLTAENCMSQRLSFGLRPRKRLGKSTIDYCQHVLEETKNKRVTWVSNLAVTNVAYFSSSVLPYFLLPEQMMSYRDPLSGHQTTPKSLPVCFALGMCRQGFSTIRARATAGQATRRSRRCAVSASALKKSIIYDAKSISINCDRDPIYQV